MTLAETRKALATEDYKAIGEYLCEEKHDEEVIAYLRHHVPKEKQEQWDVCANQVSTRTLYEVYWDRSFVMELARYREMSWGCLFDQLVSVDVTEGFRASASHQQEKIIIVVDSVREDADCLGRTVEAYAKLLPAVRFRFGEKFRFFRTS